MTEGVDADDRLVRLHAHAGELRDEPADAVDLPRVDVRRQVEEVGPGLDRHHDLFERGVARALADTVDADLDLPRPGLHRRQAVRHGEAQVVVAVHREASLIDVRHVLLDGAQRLRELVGDRVADGVRDVYGRGAGVDHFCQHAVDVLRLGASGVHRRELHVLAVALRARHHFPRHLQDSLLVLLQLVHDVDVRGREEDVDARARGVLDGLPAGVDVVGDGPRQAGDHRLADLPGDRRH